MGLLSKISHRVGKTVSPLQIPGVTKLPLRAFEKTVPQVFSQLEVRCAPAKVLRVNKGLLPSSKIGPNRLFSLPEINFQSGFESLASNVYQTPEHSFPATFISPDLLDEIACLNAVTWVSENRFIPLKSPLLDGKEYKKKESKSAEQVALFPTSEGERQREYRKAYTRTKTPNAISSHATKSLNTWDLIYPILLPPLNLSFAPQFDILNKLRPYQQTGISFLVNNESALLADEMGTGKTVMSLVALRLLFRLGKAKKAIIVCPVNLLRVWQDHLLDWASELEFTVVRGTPETRKLDWRYPAHVYLTTYETIASDFLTLIKNNKDFNCPKCGQSLYIKDRIQVDDETEMPRFNCTRCKTLLTNIPLKSSLVDKDILGSFDVVLIDEAQYIKNRTSDRSRAVKIIKPKFRWALTGTPIENRLDDLVSIFEFVKPNYLRLDGLTPAKAKKFIEPYFLRRRKVDVMPELPEKIRQDWWLELKEKQRVEYNDALQRGVSELESLGGKITKPHIFALITALKQICNFAKDGKTSSKVEVLEDIVREIKDNGHKLIVFSQYVNHGVSKLETVLKPFGVAVMKGGMSDKAKQAAIDKFKKDSEISVFLASIKTGGVGLTLTEATYVVHFDHWWNPATMWQAEDRAHRYGQREKVTVYSFWIQDTIEGKIHRKLKEKGLLFDQVINSLSEEAMEELISTDEWLEMLGVSTTVREKQPTREKNVTPKRSISEVSVRLSALDPIEFEKVVQSIFIKIGYSNVKTTKRSHDGGIDVIGYRNSVGGTEKIIAQCKRTERVGVEVARELLGVVSADQSIAKAFLVTSGVVSPEGRAFCEKDGRLAIIEGPTLSNYIIQFGLLL